MTMDVLHEENAMGNMTCTGKVTLGFLHFLKHTVSILICSAVCYSIRFHPWFSVLFVKSSVWTLGLSAAC